MVCKKILLILFFEILALTVVSQENFLSRRITLTLNHVSLETALDRIARSGGFAFSYDTRIIHGEGLVSVRANKSPVGEILSKLTGPGIRTKQVGTHLILLPAVDEIRKKKKFTISGIITDRSTSKPIGSATVYEVDGHQNNISGSDGKYNLMVPESNALLGITFCRTGYQDTVIFITPFADQEINIILSSVPVVRKLQFQEISALQDNADSAIISDTSLKKVEEIGVVKLLVPEKTREIGKNLEVYGTRTFQLSLVPYIGTNGRLSGSMANAVSLNILAGYSRETNGFELGGLVNINRQRVKGFQLGGLGNIVGESTSGFQLAGLFNINLGSVKGFQIGGLVNWLSDTLKGMRFAGLCNIATGKIRGVDIAGLVNVATRDVNGWQISGLGNIGLRRINKAQISGLVNYGRENWGFQLSGLMNISKRYNRGAQIAGLLNYTGTLNGFQLGLINIVGTLESGVPIGFFSYVEHGGYYRFEVSADEVFWTNVTYRIGTSRFYNIFKAGTGDSWMMNFTWGAGTLFPVSKLFSVALDLTIGGVFSTSSGLKYHGLQGKIYPTFDFRVAEWLSIFFGPQANVYWFNTGTTIKPDGIAPYTIYDYTFTTGPHRIQLWVGGVVGVKI